MCTESNGNERSHGLALAEIGEHCFPQDSIYPGEVSNFTLALQPRQNVAIHPNADRLL